MTEDAVQAEIPPVASLAGKHWSDCAVYGVDTGKEDFEIGECNCGGFPSSTERVA